MPQHWVEFRLTGRGWEYRSWTPTLGWCSWSRESTDRLTSYWTKPMAREREVTELDDVTILLLYGDDIEWYQEPITGRRFIKVNI